MKNYISRDTLVDNLERGKVYYCEGIDADATYTLCGRTDEYFLHLLAWEKQEGSLNFDEPVVFAYKLDEVLGLDIEDAYEKSCQEVLYGDTCNYFEIEIDPSNENAFDEVLEKFSALQENELINLYKDGLVESHESGLSIS